MVLSIDGAGYYPVSFWYQSTEFALPVSVFDMLSAGEPCYWAVVGINSVTSDYEVSAVWTFVKEGMENHP